MALYRLFDGNQGFSRPSRFRDFDLTTLSTSGATFERKDPGSYDPTRDAFTIEMTFAGATDAAVGAGIDSGGSTLLDNGRVFTGGSITSVTYKDDAGNVIAEITGVDVSLVWFDAYYKTTPELWQLYDALVGSGSRFIGANDSTGPETGPDDNYDIIFTGRGNDVAVGLGGDDYFIDDGGRDFYNGGAGVDAVTYDEFFWNPGDVFRGIRADLNARKNRDFVIGPDGARDRLVSIEQLRGTFKDDYMRGDNGENSFMGFQGRDFFDGLRGYDTLRYDRDKDFGAHDGVIVDITNGVARDPSGDFDRFRGIENVRGTDYGDTFIMRGGWADFNGRAGSDEFLFENGSAYANLGDDGETDTINASGKTFEHYIDNFDIGEDQIGVDDYTFGQTSLVDDGGEALLVFNDGVNEASIKLQGVTTADVIGAGGIGAVVDFLTPGSIDVWTLQDGGGGASPGGFKGKFQWLDGNQGFFRYSNFDAAVMDEIGNLDEFDGHFGIRLNHSGPYDQSRNWAKVVLRLEDAEWHEYESGGATTAGGFFDSGTFSGGKITEVVFYNDLGFKILKVSNVAVDLAWFAAYYSEEPNLWDFWDAMTARGGMFIGSEDSSGPVNDWEGDDIKTSAGNDIVHGRGGDDYIFDNGGSDKYIGGDGSDWIDYSQSFYNPELLTRGVIANLNARGNRDFAIGTDGKRDSLVSIENLAGSALNDRLFGDTGDNNFRGYAGNDLIVGNRGFDTADYRNDVWEGGTDGIIANLRTGRIKDGFGTMDRVIGIEGVVGTSTDDVFVDNGGDNYFRARDGEDRVLISGGNDFIRLDFDGQADEIVFQTNNFGKNDVRGFEIGLDTIEIENAVAFAEITQEAVGNDTVITWMSSIIVLQDTGGILLEADDFGF